LKMYHRGDTKQCQTSVPFEIKCTNCGSHNVDVIAFEHWDLEIKCKVCGSYLDVGKYNETTYDKY
jgi:ribosomal protein S27E